MTCSTLLRLCSGYHHKVVPSVCWTTAVRLLSAGFRPSPNLSKSYRLLQLPENGNCSHAEVKEAYLRMAKLYHPDSGAPTANAALFSNIEDAYRAVMTHLAQQESKSQYTQKDEGEEKMKGHTPQHRQYLSYEGVGFGTPSQRERQYQQFRMDRATDGVLEYRYKKMEKAAADEGAMVVRDTRLRSKKIQITQAVERLVEDLIQESMARGDFHNLTGAGKPLSKFEHNPYADPMTHNLNRILLDNGYQPEWVVTQKEIRETIGKLRERLKEVRARLGGTMKHSEQIQWKEHCAAFACDLAKLNKKVDDFNLIVPLLSWQMVHFNVNSEINKVLRFDKERRIEKEKERKQKEETENVDMSQQNTRKGIIMWVQSLLK